MPEFLLQHRRHLLAAAAALVLLLLAAHLLLPAGTTTPAAPLPASPGLGASAAAAPHARVVVDVVGAVRQPGLYRLEQGSRIADAIARAGGATPKAELAQVNLAAPLADGEQVVVPKRGAPGAVPSASGSPASARRQPRRSSTTARSMAPSAPWTSSMPFRASVRSASSSCATWWFRESHSARGRRGALRRARDCERRSHHAPRGRARGSTARRRSNEARCGLAASGLRGSVSPHRLVVGQRPARRARSERLALTRRHRGARPARHHRNRALDSLRTSRARTGQSLRAASLSRIGPARASSRSRTASREPARGDYDSPFAEAGEGWVRRTSLAQASG